MNIRVKAGLVTVGLMSTCLISILGIQAIVNFLTAEQLIMLITFSLIGVFVYVLYGITLNRLEYEQTLKEITDKK
jgi:hypothetical protein